jgi:hypothetical protein
MRLLTRAGGAPSDAMPRALVGINSIHIQDPISKFTKGWLQKRSQGKQNKVENADDSQGMGRGWGQILQN